MALCSVIGGGPVSNNNPSTAATTLGTAGVTLANSAAMAMACVAEVSHLLLQVRLRFPWPDA